MSWYRLPLNADDTQLYLSFKCHNPAITLSKLNNCISDIRVWMIKNKLKINDSKTEFIVFRSPQAKQDLSCLSVSVGDSVGLIAQSSKVRDLGVIDDNYIIDEYIKMDRTNNRTLRFVEPQLRLASLWTLRCQSKHTFYLVGCVRP